MHRGKRKSASTQGPSSVVFGKPRALDSIRKSGEALTRLRFQNKKPLCLQYNLATNSFGIKSQFRRSRRSSSLYHNFICKFLVFCKWMLIKTQAQIINFLLKPASCEMSGIGCNGSDAIGRFAYKRYVQKKCSSHLLYKLPSNKNCCGMPPLSKSAAVRPATKGSLTKRDYGRSMRLAQQMDRFAELCVF